MSRFNWFYQKRRAVSPTTARPCSPTTPKPEDPQIPKHLRILISIMPNLGVASSGEGVYIDAHERTSIQFSTWYYTLLHANANQAPYSFWCILMRVNACYCIWIHIKAWLFMLCILRHVNACQRILMHMHACSCMFRISGHSNWHIIN